MDNLSILFRRIYTDFFIERVKLPAAGRASLKILLIILGFIYSKARAQDLTIDEVDLDNGKVVIHYEIQDTNPEDKYTLRLYSSKDNFIQPLAKVTGDVGIAIPVGGNKEITWDARQELDSGYNSSVALQIKGQLYIPFITLSHFEDYGTFKRGKPYELTWSGGRGDNVLVFDLYRGNTKIWTQPNVANSGNLKLVIPKNVKPGNKYLFRISDTKDPDEVIYTGKFRVRREIPQALKIGAGLVVVGGVYFLLQQFQGPQFIPDPPFPSRN